MTLGLLILIPLLAAALVAALPAARARGTALAGTLVPLAGVIVAAWRFPWATGEAEAYAWSAEWVRGLGVRLSLGADAVSMLLIMLTALLGPICVAGSFTAVRERERTFYGWLLVLQAAMTGVFAARDAVLFYVFFEFTLIPMYVLISRFGSTNRKAAATKFFLYTFTGSVITLAGVAYVAWFHQARISAGVWSFDLATLTRAALSMSASEQRWVFLALLAGFAVKVPLFPLHTWLPLAHTEAPTAGSVVLAGVLLKLGTYGIYMIAIPFCPGAASALAPGLSVLAVLGILVAGLVCWVQTDVKKLVAYSSVAHLGFCVLGLLAFNTIGVTGSILYMINHGLSTGALFLCIGMIYERYHTRSMKELGGLARVMPVWATFMVFFSMASVGLPGLNGFVSEFMCLMGSFQAWSAWKDSSVLAGTPGELGPYVTALAGVGMIVAAMYILMMVGNVVWGPLKEPGGHEDHHPDAAGHGHGAHGALPKDLSAREIGVLLPLAAACVFLGVYPKPVMRALERPVEGLVRSVQEARERGGQPRPLPVPRAGEVDRQSGAGVREGRQ
ncbi:MAG: NADH-quinone oxidoreductase subunit M [Phycisphaerae bacterium]|nr:NADH-quinone oxidoreductase subunit M [Phycisphaerae bacterium]